MHCQPIQAEVFSCSLVVCHHSIETRVQQHTRLTNHNHLNYRHMLWLKKTDPCYILKKLNDFEEGPCCIVCQFKVQCTIMHGTCLAVQELHPMKCNVISQNDSWFSPRWFYQTHNLLIDTKLVYSTVGFNIPLDTS